VKQDAFLTQQDPKALVGDVVDHPLGHQEVRLARNGLVERVRAETDRRGHLAVLTPAGFERLEKAYPTHLAGVRNYVMDHLASLDLTALADALSRIAAADMGPPARRIVPAPA
jgi:hypothetical protein